MKRIVLILLACLLLLSIGLTGCGQTAETPGTPETTGDETPETESQAPEETKQERVTLQIAYWGSSAFGDDQFYTDISEKFNMDIEFINLEWSDFNQQLRLWAGSGEFPDVAAGPLPSNDYFAFANQGVVSAIPDDLSAYPHLAAFQGQDLMKLFEIEGKVYVLPRTHNRIYGEDAITSFRFILRKDWMQEAGYTQLPTNYKDFMDMIQAMADLKLGGDNTVGFTADSLNGAVYPFLFGMARAPLSWTKEEGKWVPGMSLDSNVEWNNFVKQYYQSGAIDRDVVIHSNSNEGKDKFMAGNAAAFFLSMSAADWDNVKREFEETTGLNASETLILSSCFLYKEEGDAKAQRQMDPLIGTGTYFSAKITPEKMDRAFQLIDYFLSDEGLMHAKAGLEGRDYTVDGDTFTSLLPVNEETGVQETFNSLNPTAGISGLAYWGVDYAFIDPALSQASKDEMKATYDWIEANCVPAEANLQIDWWGDSEDFTSWNYSTAWYAGLANIIANSTDVEGDYKALVEELMLSGGYAAQDAVNAHFD